MTRSPRHLKQQVKDTVGEQVRDLPLHAVRLAMFGVGRALLLSDRLTKDYKEITEGGGVRPVIGRLRDDVQHTAEKVVGRVAEKVRGEEHEDAAPAQARTPAAEPAKPRPAPSGGEISVGKPAAEPRARAVPDTKPEPEAKPEPKPEPEAKREPKPESKPEAEPEAEAEAAFEPKPEVKPAAPAEAEKLAEDLPVPNYDEATLPQLRARLRGLSSDQVKLLREYERKHAARPDVLRMYENRIAKLNGLG